MPTSDESIMDTMAKMVEGAFVRDYSLRINFKGRRISQGVHLTQIIVVPEKIIKRGS